MAGMRALTLEEQHAIMDALPSMRDRMLFLASLYTGFRISELLALKVRHVWREGGPVDEIVLERRSMKFGRGRRRRWARSRSVAIHPNLKAALLRYVPLLSCSGHDFPEAVLFRSKKGHNIAISYVQAYRVLTTAASHAGVTGRVATHSGRKTFVRRIYEDSGHDLVLTQRAVGHLSIFSTVSYLESTDQDIAAAVNRLPGPELRM